jgi:dGTPase
MSHFDRDVIDFAKKLEKKIQHFNYREHKSCHDEHRDEYARDYGRVLYSSSFRRLQGKMQLLGVDSTHFYRNRLTHSLEVAQIARSIASDLNLKHPVVTETCSLAHDLGNPPFGHAGEEVLNDLAKDIGGYEGNAQTFRILRYLEKKHFSYPGLNLTFRTLFGVTKYFDKRRDGVKKFLYDEDYDFLKKEIADKELPDIRKSIDAQIMDLADEIAYAAHDLEDAISSGFITLSEMMYEFKISEKFKEASNIFNQIATDARDNAWRANRLDTSEEYSFILRKKITSNIVHKLISDIGVVQSKNGANELGYKSLSKLAEGLKKLVFKAVLRKNHVQLYEKQGERIIKGLFEVYTDPKFNKNNLLLPAELRSIISKIQEEEEKNKMQKRVVIDYIAGMMDSFAMQEYKTYFGSSSLDLIYDRRIWKE